MITSRHKTGAFYDRISRWYDLFSSPWEEPLRQAGIQKLVLNPGETVLEIGLGTGHAIAALAQGVGPTGRVYGLELSPRMLALAAKRLSPQEFSSSVLLLAGDATCLPFRPESIDAVFASFVIELFNPDEILILLDNCRKILRPCGQLCAVSMTKSGRSVFMRQIYEWTQRQFPEWIDCRPIYLAAALEKAGFKIVAPSWQSRLDLPVEIVLAAKT